VPNTLNVQNNKKKNKWNNKISNQNQGVGIKPPNQLANVGVNPNPTNPNLDPNNTPMQGKDSHITTSHLCEICKVYGRYTHRFLHLIEVHHMLGKETKQSTASTTQG
jgi:hypothetical protein